MGQKGAESAESGEYPEVGERWYNNGIMDDHPLKWYAYGSVVFWIAIIYIIIHYKIL